jgi:hypothetical protein
MSHSLAQLNLIDRESISTGRLPTVPYQQRACLTNKGTRSPRLRKRGLRRLSCLPGHTLSARRTGRPTVTFQHSLTLPSPSAVESIPVKSWKATKSLIHHSPCIPPSIGLTPIGLTSIRLKLKGHPPPSTYYPVTESISRPVTKPIGSLWKYSPKSFYTRSKTIRTLKRI